MTLYYILPAAVAALLVAVFITAEKTIKNKKVKEWIFKGLTLLFLVAFVTRYLSAKMVMINTVGLNIRSPFGIHGQTKTVFTLLTIWVTFAAAVLLQTYAFFKEKIAILKHLVKFFAAVIYLVDYATIHMQITGLFGAAAANTLSLSGVSYAVEVGIALGLSAMVWIKEYRTPFSWRRAGCYFACLLGMLFTAIPAYFFQVLFGYGPLNVLLQDFNFAHRMVLYGAFLLPLLVTVVLYRQDYEHKRYALLFISLATLLTFCSRYVYQDLKDLSAYPFHICNLAMFIVPICLIFKLDKVYYFTFFVNVLGALLAMLMPDQGEKAFLFAELNVNFFTNHYCAFFMPLLLVVLKIYDRPKMKEMGYYAVGFALYFVLVLFVNAYFTSKGNETDFFYINSDFIASKIGTWAEHLREITVSIPTKWGTPMVIYPVYQVLYFLGFMAMSFGMWYLYVLGFRVQDAMEDLFTKNAKIRSDMRMLEESLKGRDRSEPINMNATNKLILKNFCKKYSTSNVYAVKDANLEIDGGQIFGFLGPNGAGKSTIIKSIVGIQSITSGSIEVCGYDVEKQSVQAKMQIGFVPDHYALYENLTGREYINYIANLYGVSIEDRNRRMDEYVERFHLQGSFENPIKTYSHGMKQKITIMSALVHDPKVWILDEPLTGLDPDSIFEVKETMKAHAAKGNIVFFSSHIIDVVERICDKIAIIKYGHIIRTADMKDLEDKKINLENFYRDTVEMADVAAAKVTEDAAANRAEEGGKEATV